MPGELLSFCTYPKETPQTRLFSLIPNPSPQNRDPFPYTLDPHQAVPALCECARRNPAQTRHNR